MIFLQTRKNRPNGNFDYRNWLLLYISEIFDVYIVFSLIWCTVIYCNKSYLPDDVLYNFKNWSLMMILISKPWQLLKQWSPIFKYFVFDNWPRVFGGENRLYYMNYILIEILNTIACVCVYLLMWPITKKINECY